MGFPDMPPEPGGGRDNPKSEEKPDPPSAMPVYTVRQSDTESDSGSGSGFFKQVIAIAVGVVAVVAILAAGAYYYKMEGPGIGDKKALSGGGVNVESLKIEMTRTLQVLNDYSGELKDDPEKLKKVEAMKKEIQEILESIGEKTAPLP